MGGAPVWLSYVSVSIAAVAALVAILTYRRSSSTVKAEFILRTLDRESPLITFTIGLYNRGSSGIEIIDIQLHGTWWRWRRWRRGILFDRSLAEFLHDDPFMKLAGPRLPTKIEQGSSATWLF